MRILALYPRAIAFRHARAARYSALLRALGVRLIVADDEAAAIDARWCDEKLELPAAERVDAAWSDLRAWLARHPIDAVVAQSEAGLLLGSLATREAELRGPTPRAAYLCTSKLACRLALEVARVPQPRFALARTTADVRAFARAEGYPVVLKGVASAAQRLVTLVRDASAVDGGVARVLAGLGSSADIERLGRFARLEGIDLGCDPRREFLVESFAPGIPLEVDGLVAGRAARSFGVTEQVHAREPAFFIEGYLFPADRTRAEIDAVERVARAAIAAVGLTDGAYSIEVRCDGADAQLIEINGRLGADEGFGDLFEATIGAQPALLAAQVALGRSPRWRAPRRCAAVAYRSCYSGGVVRRAPSAADLSALARRNLALEVHVAPGTRLQSAASPCVRPHVAHALATDPRSSRAAFERARRAVTALDLALAPLPESAALAAST
jgi:biotin carboxylase